MSFGLFNAALAINNFEQNQIFHNIKKFISKKHNDSSITVDTATRVFITRVISISISKVRKESCPPMILT